MMKIAVSVAIAVTMLTALLAVPGAALARQMETSTLGYHVVQWGETMFCIGRAYGVNPYAIGSYNGIANISYIYAGQVLAIPNVAWVGMSAGKTCARQFGVTTVVTTVVPVVTVTPVPVVTVTPVTTTVVTVVCSTTYVVKRGDWLVNIAAMYNRSWRDLAWYNHLPNANLIYPGQVLCIP